MQRTAHPPSRTHSAPSRLQHVAAWCGLVGVPLIWAGHVLLSEMLVATACTRGVPQYNGEPWPVVHGLLALLSVAAIALALAGALAAWRAWRGTAALQSPKRETFRFIAWCGTAVSVAFTIALIFTISVLVALPFERMCGTLR
jgi:hypothetical protein